MITISTNLLEAIAKWSYVDTDRPHITCVLFDRKHVVATDGHRLVRVPIKNPGPKFTVARPHLFAAIEAQHAMNARELTLSLDGTVVTIGIAPKVTMTVPVGPEGYPPYEQVIPKGADDAPLAGYCINPKYLAAVDEVHRAIGGGPHCGVRIVGWGGELDPLKLEGAGGSEFVIMPMRAP